MKKPMNLVSLMNLAWDRKTKCSVSEYEIKIKNLLSHSYTDLTEMFENYCRSEGIKYNDEVFVCFQRVMIFLMLSDGDFLQGEYDAYCRVCDYCGFRPLSVSDCRSYYNNWSTDVLVEQIKLLKNLRDTIDPDNYEAMVQGFCYLSLCGDKAFDEDEYYILRCFFEPGYDYAPSTWEQFKREW